MPWWCFAFKSPSKKNKQLIQALSVCDFCRYHCSACCVASQKRLVYFSHSHLLNLDSVNMAITLNFDDLRQDLNVTFCRQTTMCTFHGIISVYCNASFQLLQLEFHINSFVASHLFNTSLNTATARAFPVHILARKNAFSVFRHWESQI